MGGIEMAVAPSLTDNLLAYERHKEQLIMENEGRFVVIQGGAIAGCWDTYRDAIQSAYQQFGLTTFLVKRIERTERVDVFFSDLPVYSS